jgi:hypothetical protein
VKYLRLAAEQAMSHSALKLAETIPLIAPLLNLQLPPQYPSSPLSPEQRRRRDRAKVVL